MRMVGSSLNGEARSKREQLKLKFQSKFIRPIQPSKDSLKMPKANMSSGNWTLSTPTELQTPKSQTSAKSYSVSSCFVLPDPDDEHFKFQPTLEDVVVESKQNTSDTHSISPNFRRKT